MSQQQQQQQQTTLDDDKHLPWQNDWMSFAWNIKTINYNYIATVLFHIDTIRKKVK